jgi:flagellar motor switch protein FliM
LSDILSQDEIEALLSSLSDGGGGGGSSPAGETGAKAEASSVQSSVSKRTSSRSAVAYEVYDFRRPDKFSKEQLRTLQMLHETFGRLAGTNLSGLLRTNVSIDLISLEQVPYEEYLRSISSSVFTIFSIPPLSGQAAIEMEFDLIFTMIDKLLGGPGRSVKRQNLTDIEEPLFHQVVSKMFMALKSAWEGVVIVNPSIEEIETSAQFVQIAPPSDIVVSILFEVRVGDAHGALSLCIPYMVLKPITAKLSAQKWFAATSNRKQTVAHRTALTNQLASAPVDVTVRMGKCGISVKDFLLLRQDDVIRLNQKVKQDMVMTVANQDKFHGIPSKNGNSIAFHINGIVNKD